MIIGIGTDIIEIDRIKKSKESTTFLNKVFTSKEIMLYSKNIYSLSGNFAAKEAIAKAFKTGFRSFGPKDIEILRDESGAPYVVLFNKALNIFKEKKATKLHISISHNKSSALAYAILEK